METWDVFISYATEDKESIATPLYNKLKELGLIVWYDKSKMKKGRNTATQISHAIKESKYIIIIYSPNYKQKHKKWTKSEENIASYLSIEKGKIIIPIYHEITEEVLEDIDEFIKPNLAYDTEKIGIEELSSEIAKDVFESNLIDIFREENIKVDELQEIILEKISHLDKPEKDRIRKSNEISELMEWAYDLDCNFISIVKEIKHKKNIEHTNIENYIKLLKKIHDKNCIDIEENKSLTPPKIIGIVVDITSTDTNKNLYSVEVGVKYANNTFKVKQCDENVYITERDNTKLKETLSTQLTELISEHNFAIETLIEFILPISLLEIDFKDLTIITKRRQQKKCLIEYFNYIIRSKERIEDHLLDEDKNWIKNWKIYKSNKKNPLKESLKEINKTREIGAKITKAYPCIVQNFSLKDSIDNIIDCGISIVLSPLSNNFSKFHKLVSDTFGKKELCYLYEEYYDFIRDECEDEDEDKENKKNKEENRFNMLILWDDPTNIPNKENSTALNKGV